MAPPTAAAESGLNITVEEDSSQAVSLEKMIDIGESQAAADHLPALQTCETFPAERLLISNISSFSV